MASTKISALRKIDSPLAKYNSAGQLMCIICNTVVKSEMVWTAHINGRQHREQVIALKKAKETPAPKESHALKRKSELDATSCTEAAPSPVKKGIPSDFFDKKPTPIQNTGQKVIKGILKNSSKPKEVDTLEDNAMEVEETPTTEDQQTQETQKEVTSDSTVALPEGFFDDPKLDAKVRNNENLCTGKGL